MGYNPQRNRPRPRVSESTGPAPVDSLLDHTAVPDHEASEADAAIDVAPASGVSGSAPERASVAAAPLTPATPTPARVAPMGRIVAAVAIVGMLLVALRLLARRRRRD